MRLSNNLLFLSEFKTNGMNIKSLFFIALFFSILFSFSCKKKVEKKIEGTWHLIDVTQKLNDSLPKAYWIFERNTLKFKNSYPDFMLNSLDSATKANLDKPWDEASYTIRWKMENPELVIKGLDAYEYIQTFYNGNWRITKLTKDNLTIVMRKKDTKMGGMFTEVLDFVKVK